MLRIILSGCLGQMGKVITNIVENREDCEIVCGVDIGEGTASYPIFDNVSKINVDADCIIDFSHPSALNGVLDYAKSKGIAAVIATTGLSSEQIEEVKAASKVVPVFFSFNMSLGVNLLLELSKKAAQVLNGFDIEIIEKHHNQKIDAPSGTAVMLAEGINEAKNNAMLYEYDRHSKRQKRTENEIGIHAVRGGTIVGEHDVLFCGRDEIITLSHSARSKDIFAVGAVNAALFIADKPQGLYNMGDLVK